MKESILAKKYLEIIAGQEQYPPLTNARPFTQINGWNSAKYFLPHYDDKLPFPDLFISKNGQGYFYLPATKIKNLSKEVFEKYWFNQSIRQEREKQYDQLQKKVNGIYEKYAFVDNDNLFSFEEALNDLRQAKDTTWSLNALVFFSIYFDLEIAEEMLRKFVSHISQLRLQELWPIISAPISDSFAVRRKKIFLSENRGKASLSDLAKKLRFIEASYDYVPRPNEIEKIFSKKYGKWLDQKKASEELEQEKMKSIIRADEWKQKIKDFSEDEKKLSEYIQWIIALRDERKDVISKFLSIAHIIGFRLFKELSLPLDLLYFSPMDEWCADPEKMRKRVSRFEALKEDAVILIDWSGKTEFEFRQADSAVAIVNNVLKDKRAISSDCIIGQVGSPGIKKGVVKIILDITGGANNFSKGDILVTGMTRPEFLPIMKKASAIITDEGSITCHAAIVAREMKKPCIIGTKIATQVLKDGDFVEVDAVKGIVKIINKNKGF